MVGQKAQEFVQHILEEEVTELLGAGEVVATRRGGSAHGLPERVRELGALLPVLYLHGLAEGDFELALRGLLGDGAPLSKASIQRLRQIWTEVFET